MTEETEVAKEAAALAAADELAAVCKKTRLIGVAMIISVVIYAVLVEALKRVNAPFNGFLPGEWVEIMRYVLLGFAVIAYFMTKVVRDLLFKMDLGSVGSVSPKSGEQCGQPSAQTILQTYMIVYCISSGIAVLGLALFLVGGNSTDFYIFFAISIFSYLRYFPKLGFLRERFKECARGY